MATLEDILADVGLGETQTKTASAPAGKPSTKEVNEVLENLGLDGGIEAVEQAGATKTASAERNDSMTDIYEKLFGEAEPTATPGETEPTAQPGQEKTASGEPNEVAPADESTALGELTGIYFNVMHDACIEKVAGDLEMEAGKGYQPQASAPGTGELAKIVGKEGDPALPNNYDASSGKPLVTNPGNQTPYSLKARGQIKEILKRRMKMEPGDLGGYNE